MPRAAKISTVIAVLLLITMSIKAAIMQADVQPANLAMAQEMRRSLTAQGWTAAAIDDNLFPYLRAAKGDCQLVAAAMAPNAAPSRRFAMQMRSFGPTRFVYGGEFLQTPPRAIPVLVDYFQRKIRPLGFDFKRVPVLAIAAGAGCKLDAADWRDFRIGTLLLRRAGG